MPADIKALVTGAAGFVGRHLAAALAAEGAEVLGLDAAAPAGSGAADGGTADVPPVLRCDLRDAPALLRETERFGPQVVFHLAGQSSAARSFEDPRGTFEANVMGTLGLLEAVRRGSPRARVVVVGSGEEYGLRSPDEMPLGEDSPVEPANPYAASKAAQNLLARQYHRAWGVDVVVTRSFSHTGPGQRDTFVLPSFARQCAEISAGRREAVIRTGNLEVTRDYLDVRDVVRAYIALARAGTSGAVYNVCSGEGLNLAEALRTLTALAGGGIQVETDPALLRPVDAPVLVGDNRRLRGDCNWQPLIAPGRMLEDLYTWWLERAGAARS